MSMQAVIEEEENLKAIREREDALRALEVCHLLSNTWQSIARLVQGRHSRIFCQQSTSMRKLHMELR